MTKWQAYLHELKQRLGCQSDSQFARRIGVSQATVSRWFSGGRARADEVIKVAQATGDDPIRLLQLAGCLHDTPSPSRADARSVLAEERVRYLATFVEQLDERDWQILRQLIERLAESEDAS